MFTWDLVFFLFKCIASNEREEKRFFIKQVLWFSVFFPKENKILFEL